MYRRVATLCMILFLGMLALGGRASAATYTTLYSFTLADTFWPQGGLVEDSAGNLYGTTIGGGTYGYGSVFQLSPPAVTGGAWTKKIIYTFLSYGAGGGVPSSELIVDSAGALYGTTWSGGDATCACGVVYKLTPPATQGAAWTEQPLYGFVSNGADGRLPSAALTLDSAGNIYGVTQQGGTYNGGVAFKLTPKTGGTYAESVLYSFGANSDASAPNGPLAIDSTGALYGVACLGGTFNLGATYKLTPPTIAGQPWTEAILFSFGGGTMTGGTTPVGNLVFDSAGNLYGVTNGGGNRNGNGVAYQLTPATGTWKQTVLFTFSNGSGVSPAAGLTWNPSTGSLYGTTTSGNPLKSASGTAFQLTPPAVAGGKWTEVNLHNFAFFGDGGVPSGRITRDASTGTLYGTTVNGGLFGCDGYCGVIYQIQP